MRFRLQIKTTIQMSHYGSMKTFFMYMHTSLILLLFHYFHAFLFLYKIVGVGEVLNFWNFFYFHSSRLFDGFEIVAL